MTWYAVDGMDGSGKTTSSDFLREQLMAEGRKVLEITHPNSETSYGRTSAKYLCRKGKGAVMISTLFYILDVLHSLRYKRKHGKEYDDVIFVRYSLAAAYMPESLCKPIYKIIEFVLPIPDVKIYVDIDPKIALERIYERGEELETFETAESLEKTRRRMGMITDSWIKIDNSGTPEQTREQTKRILEEVRKHARSHAQIRRRDIAAHREGRQDRIAYWAAAVPGDSSLRCDMHDDVRGHDVRHHLLCGIDLRRYYPPDSEHHVLLQEVQQHRQAGRR